VTDALWSHVVEHEDREEDRMHSLMLSLFVALVVCVLVLAAFAVFTTTPRARRLQQGERRPKPRAR